MRNKFAALAGLIALTLCTAVRAASAAVVVDVHNSGALGDGATSDTRAIQQAIDDCNQQGGGTVHFPAGRYVSGTILLKDNVTLRLDEQAVLLGSTNIADYLNVDPFRSGNGAEMGYCFVGAVDVKNVGIEGAGLIDGRGKELLAARGKGNNARPFLVRFVRCTGVSVNGVHLQGPAAWTMHFFQSRDVKADQVRIASHGLSNNDGIDIDSCTGVQIKDCDIDSDDDSVCLKTTSTVPCRNIEVTGCKLRSRWGGIKFGTESVANFEEITITDCQIRDARGGLKLLSVDGANLRNVVISNLTMDNVNTPIFVRLGARLRTFRAGDEKQPVGTVKNVRIKNVRAQAISPVGIIIAGIPGHAIEDLSLENIQMRLPGGGTREAAHAILEEKESAYPEFSQMWKQFPAYGVFARHVKGLEISGMKLEVASPDLRPAVVCQDVENLKLTDWTLPANADAECLVRLESTRKVLLSGFAPSGKLTTFLRVEGADSGQIELKDNRVGAAKTVVQLGDGVKEETIIAR